MPTFWLTLEDGTQRRIGRGGLVLGRRHDCDIVLDEPGISRQHALLRETASGAELIVLGRTPTWLDDTLVTEPRDVPEGATLRLGTRRLSVSARSTAGSAAGSWSLQVEGGTRIGLPGTTRVGGGAQDDVVIPDWPSGAAVLHPLPATLVVELGAAGEVSGRPHEAGALLSLPPGAILRFAGRGAVVACGDGGMDTTAVASAAPLPIDVALHFHERGGLLHLRFPDSRGSVYLPDRRCDLVAALLRPTGEAPGTFVPDALLAARIWPGDPSKGRVDLNTLLMRARRTLLDAGFDGPALLPRAEGGGATRFVFAPGARVTVE